MDLLCIDQDQETPQKVNVKRISLHDDSKLKEGNCLIFLHKIINSNYFEIFMTQLTFLVLYADDIRGLTLTKVQKTLLLIILRIRIFIFTIQCLCVSGFIYWKQFLFQSFDLSILCLLIFGWILQYVMTWFNLQDISTSGTSQIAKAGRATRVSSRASKAARVVRLIRLVRLAKLYKFAQKQIENKIFGQRISMMEPRQLDKKVISSTNRIKSERDQIIQNHVLYNYKMIPKPLQVHDLINNYANYEQNSVRINQNELNLNSISRQSQMLVKPQNKYSTVKVEINRVSLQKDRVSFLKVSDPDFKNKSEKSIYLLLENNNLKSNKLIRNQIQQESLYDLNKIVEYNQNFNYQECPDIIQNQQEEVQEQTTYQHKKEENIQETKVGKTLSDLTTKRIIVVIFSVILSIPLLDVDTYYTQYNAYSAMVDSLESVLFNSQQGQWLQFWINCTNNFTQQNNIKLLYYNYDNYTIINDPLLNNLRSTEVNTYYSNRAVIIIDDKANTDLNSILSLARTTFLVIVMISGAVFFTNDTQQFLVLPIESMLEKVKRICDHPLEVAQIEEEIALAEDQMDKKELKEYRLREKDETQVLENLIVKTGALLAIGFGQAGAEIIAQNLKQQEFNPLIPGKKVFAIWGFCDIRNFIDMNEILEERVMVFVNEIAHIVHSTVHKYEGAANKNIGDAFLLVWKFPSDVLQYIDDKPKIIDMRMVNNYADMALIAFLKIFFRVRLSLKIARYSEAPEVQTKLPGYSIKMGFGLHVGWAIEGAVGSESKIDASYLSPNVNLTSRLEGATKQYGVFLLCSGVFYRLLSKESQSKLRHIDRCTVKGSIQAIDFFTFDIDLHQITIENMPIKKKGKLLKNKNIIKFLKRKSQAARLLKMKKQQFNINSLYNKNDIFTMVQIKYTDEFLNIFHDGINNYLAGQWKNAKRCLNTTKKMIEPFDGPSQTILNFMSKFQYISPPDWRGYRNLQDK